MATYTPSTPISQLGRGGDPPVRTSGGGDGGSGNGGPNYGARLRRARLGLGRGIAPGGMIFFFVPNRYIVRQGLPTFDNASRSYVHDWGVVNLPWLLLGINTLILLFSSFTMEGARRQITRQAALAPVKSIPGGSLGKERRFPWP